MPAVANIVLPDAQATPVNHTFIPLGPDTNGVWWFEDQAFANPIGFQRISISLTRPGTAKVGESSKDRIYRLRLGVHLPRLETLSNNSAGFTPSPTVAYSEKLSLEMLIPERSTLQDRKDGSKYMSGLITNALVVDMIENLRNLF